VVREVLRFFAAVFTTPKLQQTDNKLMKRFKFLVGTFCGGVGLS